MAKQEVIQVGKNEYLLQHPGIRYSEQMKDDAKDKNGKMQLDKFYQAIMRNVIFEPNVSFKYFDEIDAELTKEVEGDNAVYQLVYPGAKETALMMNRFMDGSGRPSEMRSKEQLLKHIVKIDGEEVTFEYFDKVGGIKDYNLVVSEASDFIQEFEFQKVMAESRRFLTGE